MRPGRVTVAADQADGCPKRIRLGLCEDSLRRGGAGIGAQMGKQPGDTQAGQRKNLSDGVVIARIPHFYYNYYVFQYATGYAAAIALSRRILREGKPAVEDYLRFLSGGCSQDPIDLLKIAGVDMSSPAPVQQALDLFGQLLDEMEAL